MKWHRTDKGLSTDGYRIERDVDKNIFTGKPRVWGYILINEKTNKRFYFGTVRDAKWWVENGWA